MDSTPTNPARRQILVSILHAYQQHEEKYSQDLAVGQGNLSLQLQALIGQGLKKEFDDTLVARYVQPTATGPTPASLVGVDADLARQHPTHLVKLLNFSARHAAYMATRLPQPPSSSSAAAVEHGADDDDHPAQWAQRAGGSGCTRSSDGARAMAVHVRLHDMAAVQHSTMLLLARPAEQLVLIDALLQAQGLRACARALEAQRLEVVQVQKAADAAVAGAADTATAVGEAAATAEALPLPSATGPPPPAAAPAVAPQQRPLDGQLRDILERAAQLANGALTLCQQASGKLSLACKGAGSAELKVSTRMLQELADSQLGEHAAALALEVLGGVQPWRHQKQRPVRPYMSYARSQWHRGCHSFEPANDAGHRPASKGYGQPCARRRWRRRWSRRGLSQPAAAGGAAAAVPAVCGHCGDAGGGGLRRWRARHVRAAARAVGCHSRGG